MNVGFINNIVGLTGYFLMGVSAFDFIKVNGIWHAATVNDSFENFVVFGLGAILAGLNALIILIIAIDTKLHE